MPKGSIAQIRVELLEASLINKPEAFSLRIEHNRHTNITRRVTFWGISSKYN